MCKVVGYARVSTVDKQDTANQKHALDTYAKSRNMTIDEFYAYQVSSRKTASQRGIEDLLKCLKRGDTLLITELSRLSRSMSEMLPLIEKISKKGVELHVIKQNLIIRDLDSDITSKIIIQTLGICCEVERSMISERCKMTAQRLKSEGRKLGNPRLNELNRTKQTKSHQFAQNLKPIVEPMIQKGVPQRSIVAQLNTAGIKTPTGKEWGLVQLQRMIARF